MRRPTDTAYTEIQAAFDHFNFALFEGTLPPCLLTLQREKQTCGYFSADRFVSMADGSFTDEIALNPAQFALVPIEEVMQTLVHEMVHLWQHRFGKPGRARYHNKEWADKMEAIGLMPSNTGRPGGMRTGDAMADYLIPGGRFDVACKELLSQSFRISWADRYPSWYFVNPVPSLGDGPAESQGGGIEWNEVSSALPHEAAPLALMADGVIIVPQARPAKRTKFTCPTCQANLWGKASLDVICGSCEVHFEPTGAA